MQSPKEGSDRTTLLKNSLSRRTIVAELGMMLSGSRLKDRMQDNPLDAKFNLMTVFCKIVCKEVF